MLSIENIYVTLFSLPVYQLMFFTILLIGFNLKENLHKFFLGILVLILTIFLICNTLFFLGYFSIFRYLYVIHAPLLLLIIPVYYLYLDSLTGAKTNLNTRKRVILFLPAIALIVVNFISLMVIPAHKLELYLSNLYNFSDANAQFLQRIQILGFGILLSGQLLFLFKKFYWLLKTSGNIEDSDSKNFTYLNKPWIILVFISIVVFVIWNSLINIFPLRDYLPVIITYNIFMILTGGTIGYFGMRQDNLFNQVIKLKIPGEEDLKKDEAVVQKKKIKDEKAEYAELIENLRGLLATRKLHLNKNLEVSDLAKELSTGTRELSYILNKVMKTNFYGLVNEYRVMEAKEILNRNEYSNLTLEAISDKVGFKSKSSFNACFKKMTGQTPSEYRNNGR